MPRRPTAFLHLDPDHPSAVWNRAQGLCHPWTGEPDVSRLDTRRRRPLDPCRMVCAMTDKSARAERQEEAEPAELETRPGAPDVIYLPDQSQPAKPQLRRGPSRSGKMTGRHFGRKPVKDPLDAWLPATRCSREQRAAADAAAQRAGLSLNAYQRQIMFGDPGPRAHRRRSGPAVVGLAQMLAALGRSGNNLNQLLRRVNSYDFRGIPEVIEMCEVMTAAFVAHHALVLAIKAELGV